jgi:hypothetical protein
MTISTKAASKRAPRAKKSATSTAIATDLAPAVAIALLDKSEQRPGEQAPALECIAAAASPSDTTGMVRVQLLFENGAVLPVEMSTEAGAALSKGLATPHQKK